MRHTVLFLAGIAAALAAPAVIAQSIPTGSELVSDLTACRSVTESAQRLACYDAAAAKLQNAQQAKQLVILDKGQVKETRRGLFGFSLPSLKVFGDAEGDEEFAQIETTLKSLERDGLGKYQFVLADGAVWRQIDSGRVRPGAKSGSKVVIRKAALGSFLMNIDNQAAIRVKRVG